MNNKNDFKPFIPADKVVPEMTAVSVILGLLLAVVFGAANAYLGLRVGMTVSASIPAAVISMGIIRIILKRDSILENNMVQTIGSAGESLAAGIIFTLPALFMWAHESGGKIETPSIFEITAIALCGGLLGTLFMIPLRQALIVDEHGTLPFPEGTACAEVLLAGEEGGSRAKAVFTGLGLSAVYKFIADGMRMFPSEVEWPVPAFKTYFGLDILPSLLGIGYICGLKIASYMFGGAILGWFVIMPLLVTFGGDSIVEPAKEAVSTMDPWGLWGTYIRYIGAGAVACGGIISLVKSLPTIIKTFSTAIGQFGRKADVVDRTSRDLPIPLVMAGGFAIGVVIWLLPAIPVSFIGALLIVIFGFFFATVSSRMVGLVGSSNNPVSGMAIATLIISAMLLKSSGLVGYPGMISTICIGTVICIVAAMAGDTSQDLKTGYILGASPYKQQIGEILGAIISALVIGGIVYLLDAAWGYGSKELPAPQAMLMKLVTEGVMGGTLPWGLVLSGAAIAAAVEVLGIPVLPFAVGLYLPLHLSVPIYIGGLIRQFFQRNREQASDADLGVLYSSGLIAGEGLVGILLAVCAVMKIGDRTLMEIIDTDLILGQTGGMAFFILLTLSLVYYAKKKL